MRQRGDLVLFFSVTHNPDAIKLHGILVEILDFLTPPGCCFLSEEVRECSVGPVELAR